MISEKKGRILFLTLDRPDRGNSLDPETILSLRTAFLDAQTDPKVNIISLTGMGEKDFCTGIDIHAASDLSAENKTNIANLAGDIATLIYMGKPTIIALNGRSMGMGIVFATAADYRIAAEGISMQMPEVNVGIYPGASCIVQMTRVCGESWARKILMGGEKFGTKEALEANIVDEVVPFEFLHKHARQMARNLSKKNPTLLKCIKNSIVSMKDLSYGEGIRMESEYSQYYTWEDSEKHIKSTMDRFNIDFPLIGEPELLKQELHL